MTPDQLSVPLPSGIRIETCNWYDGWDYSRKFYVVFPIPDGVRTMMIREDGHASKLGTSETDTGLYQSQPWTSGWDMVPLWVRERILQEMRAYGLTEAM